MISSVFRRTKKYWPAHLKRFGTVLHYTSFPFSIIFIEHGNWSHIFLLLFSCLILKCEIMFPCIVLKLYILYLKLWKVELISTAKMLFLSFQQVAFPHEDSDPRWHTAWYTVLQKQSCLYIYNITLKLISLKKKKKGFRFTGDI